MGKVWWALLTLGILFSSSGGSGLGEGTNDWFQYGGDAANTGRAQRGPELPEVAFRTDLPAGRAAYAAPLVVGGQALVLTAPSPGERLAEVHGVHRVDLDSGTHRLALQAAAVPTAFALDGERLFVVTEASLAAYPWTEDGPLEQAWSVAHPAPVADPHRVSCPFVKIAAGTVYVACLAQGAAADNPVYGENGEFFSVLFVRALDAITGEVRWTWTKDATGQLGVDDASEGAGASTGTPFVTYLNGFAVIGPYVIVTGIDGLGDGGFAEVYAWALDAREGSFLWRRGSNEAAWLAQGDTAIVRNAAEPTGTPTAVFLKLDDLVAVNPARNSEIWRRSLGQADSQAEQNLGTGLALNGPALFAASRESVYRMAADGREEGWSRTLDPTLEQVYTSTHLHTAGDLVYARSRMVTNASAHTMRAFDVAAGDPLWHVDLLHDGGALADLHFMTAVGDGVIVAAGMDGSVHVIGRTEASMQIESMASETYPPPGVAFTVSAGATRPPQAAPTRWRAFLPDGTATEWSDVPELTLSLADPGEQRIIVQARNEAGQIAAAPVVVDVGGQAAAAPGLVRSILGNQDLVWGVVGILVALIGAALAVWGRRRRRRLLEREMNALDRLARAHGHDPLTWQAAVTARRSHIEHLLMRGRLDEAHVAILTQRIDHLSRDVQGRAVDERLGFLNHSLALRVRSALRDGRITATERQAVEAMLDEAGLARDERQAVHAFLDEWTTA